MSEELGRRPTASGALRMGSLAAVLWALGITISLVVVASALASGTGASAEVAGGFVQFGVYLGAVLLIRRTYMRDMSLRQAIALRRPPIAMCLLAIVIGVSARIWLPEVHELILERYPLPAGFDQSGLEGTTSPLLIAIRIGQLGLLIPFSEELLFRGGLMRPLLVGRTRMEPLVITSLLFCMVHVYWQIAVPILPLALCFGALRISSGSLVPSMLVHMTFNASPFVLGLVPHMNRYITWPVLIASVVACLAAAAGAFMVGRTNAVAVRNRAFDA